ncbi:hypothetical protein [Actinomyces bowdenii]|uniref:Uncharacterized protein n=1 Tax=Actinomyces bowdenii TaxID=131109 RepID=A0A853EFV7_9ACTO|nr:hypothetical protein [Actinomyces bowdenii]MBF0696124.1 hypothetical protein [Actinomyces bowdenii]NYS68297.1 hypothetical protein [Actinomyces bowdenii]
MAVTATPLAGPAPVIQVVISPGTVPAGQPMRVIGQTSRSSWTVRGGERVSDGGQVILGDALAPINTPITYRVMTTTALLGRPSHSDPVIRPWGGYSLMTDVIGGHRVDLLWQGDDARDIPQRVALHEISGRRTPVAVMDPVMGAGTVALTARTNWRNSRALSALAGEARVVALFHNPRPCFQCQRGVCDVPQVTVMALTSVAHKRTSRVDEAEREWTLKGTVVAPPQPRATLAVSTWDHFDGARLTWDQVDAMSLPWDGFDRTIWQEVG